MHQSSYESTPPLPRVREGLPSTCKDRRREVFKGVRVRDKWRWCLQVYLPSVATHKKKFRK